jgi:DNA-binding NarL/FixJ family response regulator
VRVLVVDDSSAVRSRLVARLREWGLEVAGEAAGGAEALTLARRMRPHAVVLDLHLRDGSGIEILAGLKAEGLMVAVITNEVHPEYRRRCLALGADFFFDKSKEFDLVAGVLAGAKARSRIP